MATVDDPRWPSDDLLADALRGGDAEAFAAVVRTLHAPLVRMARTYVPQALAEEVVQDTWLAVINALDGFEGRASLKSWIYRIMLNRVRRVAQREAKVVPFASAGPAQDTAPAVDPARLGHPELGAHYWPDVPHRFDALPEERLLSDEVLALVAKLIDQLPGAQREVVRLRDVEGWTGPEVCDALGVSAANQRVLLHRGRSAIRSALEEYFDD